MNFKFLFVLLIQRVPYLDREADPGVKFFSFNSHTHTSGFNGEGGVAWTPLSLGIRRPTNPKGRSLYYFESSIFGESPKKNFWKSDNPPPHLEKILDPHLHTHDLIKPLKFQSVVNF